MNKVGTNLNDSPDEGKCSAIDLDILRGVMPDEALHALSIRNARRLIASRQALGERWLVHPVNAVQKQVRTIKEAHS